MSKKEYFTSCAFMMTPKNYKTICRTCKRKNCKARRMKYNEPTNCDECNYMIIYEDEDKWSEPVACGKCGRTKEEIIRLQKEYEN